MSLHWLVKWMETHCPQDMVRCILSFLSIDERRRLLLNPERLVYEPSLFARLPILSRIVDVEFNRIVLYKSSQDITYRIDFGHYYYEVILRRQYGLRLKNGEYIYVFTIVARHIPYDPLVYDDRYYFDREYSHLLTWRPHGFVLQKSMLYQVGYV